MKKFIYAVLMMALVGFSAFAQKSMTVTQDKMSIDIPQGWIVQNVGEQVSMIIYIPGATDFNYNITVTSEKLTAKTTVAEAKPLFWTGISAAYPNSEIIKDEKDTLLYTISLENGKVCQYVKIVKVKDVFYFLCLTADSQENCEALIPEVEKVYSTLKIK